MSVSFKKCLFLSDFEHHKNAGNPQNDRMRRVFRRNENEDRLNDIKPGGNHV